MRYFELERRDFPNNNKEQRKKNAACQKEITQPPPSRNVIARTQFKYDHVWRIFSKPLDLFFGLHVHSTEISRTRNPKAITRCMLQRSSVILALLDYKKFMVDLELKMTSNFGHAWKDLPFNNIVQLVAYSNKNLAEISRKCRI